MLEEVHVKIMPDNKFEFGLKNDGGFTKKSSCYRGLERKKKCWLVMNFVEGAVFQTATNAFVAPKGCQNYES